MALPRLQHAGLTLAYGCLILHGSILRAADSARPGPEFTPVTWLPAASAALARAAVSTAGIAMAPAETVSRKGDTVTLLVQSTEGGRLRQWAVVLSIDDLKPAERQLRSQPMTLYFSTGREVHFPASPLADMLIHVFGPYSKAKGDADAKAVWSGSLINPQFLGLGLDGAAAFLLRLGQLAHDYPAYKGQNFSLGVSSNPFPADKIAADRVWIQRIAITEAEDRSFAGLIPAMMDFLQIAGRTPGVREILFETLDIPWWSIVMHGGLTDANFELRSPFEPLPPAAWGLPADAKVYSIGFRLHIQGKPALDCRFAVTTPRVPLLNSAGIVGIAAMRPNGKGPRVMIRMMAAQAAPVSGLP